jgi:23S rRNA (guanosine2251-2'-O)-methyltransferase
MRERKNQNFNRSRPTAQTQRAMADRKPDFKNSRVVVGHHAIAETLKVHSGKVQTAWIQKGFESSQELREIQDLLRKAKVNLEIKPKENLSKEFPSHQGAVLFVEDRPRLDWQNLVEKKESLVLFVDGVEDPHNLGAILRTAWLMGVDALFIPQDRSVHLTASVHKVACGGVEHVPVEIVPNFSSAIEKLKEYGYWVFGLSHKASKSLYNFKLPEKMVWMVGAEDKGLRSTSEKLCDELARLPQKSAEASYNASVATALALGESCRQRWGARIDSPHSNV